MLEKTSMDVVMPFIAACRPVHYPQHLEAAGCDEAPYQNTARRRNPILSHVV
jgi:hypothetical protein